MLFALTDARIGTPTKCYSGCRYGTACESKAFGVLVLFPGKAGSLALSRRAGWEIAITGSVNGLYDLRNLGVDFNPFSQL